MSKKVLLFGDIGIDDTVALIYSYLNDDIDVVGVVADYGNISRENAVANINYVRQFFDTPESEDIRIIEGALLPMTGEIPEFVTEIHGEYGLGPIIPPEIYTDNGVRENFYEVVEIIEQYGEELVIVNVGRLTSLATLFILYPYLMGRIKDYYLMGGAFWVPGNVTSVSEANFHGDPIAAQLVLNNAENVKIIPLNVTSNAIATPEMVNYIDQIGVPLIKELLDYYYNFYKERDPNVQGSPLHDVLTLMAVNDDELLTYRELPVHIVQATQGTERGQSIADIRTFANLTEETETEIKQHQIAFELDYSKFFRRFMEVMTGQEFS